MRGLRGITNWAGVYENGLRIADVIGVKQGVLILFSVFYVFGWNSEAIDPGHSRLGAELAMRYREREFELGSEL